jgi:hypothetical protein
MRATTTSHKRRSRGIASAIVATALVALSILGGGTALAADSRAFTVTVSDPSTVSQGGATKFDVLVQSTDNQTIANVKLSLPSGFAGDAGWPAGVTIETVFGANASQCLPSNGTSLTCNFGNIVSNSSRSISILARVATSVPVGSSIVFSASAETNNENGSNKQVEHDTSGALNVVAFNADSIITANLTGPIFTSPLGVTGAGNLQTTLNLLQDNGGKGNLVAITEGVNGTQPAYCVTLKLTCQPEFTDVTVNTGGIVTPYLETILTAKVPKTYNIKKAFLIHVLTNGQVEAGFPLFNGTAPSCGGANPPVPCADFSLSKDGILTIKVHTATNGKFQY